MTHDRRDWPVRVYGALLRLLPLGLRNAHAGDAEEVFLDQYRDTRTRGGRWAAHRLFLRSTALLLACSIQARWEHDDGGQGTGRADLMGKLSQDLRFGVRSILKRPGFSLTAALVLALGIGATTTIFSVVDTVVLRQMPYPDAGRLIHFDNGAHSFPSLRAWRDLKSFETVAAARGDEVDLTNEGPPQRVPAAAVSEEFFRMLAASPHLGRLFDAGDYPGDRSVTVVGYGAWLRLWGGDPDVIGRSVRLDGRSSVVVGVMSPDFEPPAIETGSRVDFWFPLDEGGEQENDHGYHVLGVLGRLRGGTSLEAATAEVAAQRRAVAELYPRSYVNLDGTLDEVPLVALREATVRKVSTTLFLLLGAVGLMLMIACANVANLFLARGTARTREIALRSALGAGRGRLASLVFVESLVLALAGGVLGALAAHGGVALFTRFHPGGIPRIENLSVDTRVLAFSMLIAVLTGVLFGMIPALQAARADVAEALKDGSAAATTSRAGRRTRNALVVSEIGIAMVLLVAAGLLFRTFAAMTSVDPGFRVEGLTVLQLTVEAGYTDEERLSFVDVLMERVGGIPGTESVAVGWTTPFRNTGNSRCCWRTQVVGDPVLADPESPFRSIIHPVTEGYFGTLASKLMTGREFTRADMTSGVPVAILNKPAAGALFGGGDPIGRVIRMAGEELTVVGVVEGVHHWGLSQPIEQAIYVPYGQFGGDVPYVDLLVRSSAATDAFSKALQEAVWEIDAALPIQALTTMEHRIGLSVATPRFLSVMFALFAGVALLLACAGIYGSMLYSVGQRRKEMGIRLALGAGGGTVVRMVMVYGGIVALAGVTLGTAAAVATSRLMTSLVWGIQPTDPLTFMVVAGALALTAVAACTAPALKAARTDPLETLRAE
jgi:putative ABC transport system permease protein